VRLRHGSEVDLWTSRDALVLKAMSLCLGKVLPVSPRCTRAYAACPNRASRADP
jgi:hypothetical protein